MPARFRKSDRIIRQSDFDRIHRSDIFAADEVLVVKATVNSLPYTRLGLSVSRRVGNAVERNRWKRVIREAFRQSREQLPTGLDLVVRPRKGARVDFGRVRASLLNCCIRISRKIDRRP